MPVLWKPLKRRPLEEILLPTEIIFWPLRGWEPSRFTLSGKGGGTVLCSILNSDLKPAETELIKRVQELVCPPEEGGLGPSENGYGIAPIGAQVTIGTAKELILNLSCEIQFSAGAEASTYQSQVEEKIQEYIQRRV